MADPVCNVCGLPITDPAEQIDRVYMVTVRQVKLPAQKKHDACAEIYERKPGLQRRYLKEGESVLPPVRTTPLPKRTPEQKRHDALALDAVVDAKVEESEK